MKLGIIAFPTDQSIGAAELAIAVEERGFESLWYPEHSHIPLASDGWPGGPDIPEFYPRTLDQFVALTAAASVTSTLKLGTAVCLVVQHHPAWLAKQVASLDYISGGRLLLGIGFGWNRAEMEDHGVDFARRRAATREYVLAMKSLWTEEIASFEGQFVTIKPSRSWPKPVQQPHPPIIIGAGFGPKLRAAIADYADGWGPLNGRDEILAHLDEVRAAFEETGRDPGELDVTVFSAPADAAALADLAALGVTRAVLPVPPAPTAEALAVLDRHTALLT